MSQEFGQVQLGDFAAPEDISKALVCVFGRLASVGTLSMSV